MPFTFFASPKKPLGQLQETFEKGINGAGSTHCAGGVSTHGVDMLHSLPDWGAHVIVSSPHVFGYLHFWGTGARSARVSVSKVHAARGCQGRRVRIHQTWRLGTRTHVHTA